MKEKCARDFCIVVDKVTCGGCPCFGFFKFGIPHATTNEIPFERLKKEGLSPLTREYIIDKINLSRVQKDCLIPYAGNQYSVPAEYIGKDVAVMALDNMLAAYYEGKQIALHWFKLALTAQ